MSRRYRLRWRFWVLPLICAAVLLPLGMPRRALAQDIGDGLVGYWPFDEGGGSTSADLSGSGNTATLHTPNNFTGSPASTDFANPFALGSTRNANSYASAPGNNIDALQQLTVAFWARINFSPSSPDTDLLTLTNGKLRIYYARPGSVDNMFLKTTLGAAQITLGSSLNPVADGRYHHFAASWDGRFLRFYIDGYVVNEADSTAPFFPRGSLPTSQGVLFSSPTAPLDGALDDVRIYNRALSGGEVAALYYNCGSVQGIPPSECRALEAAYSSDDGSNWTSHAGWLQNATPCTWDGVLCNNGHVIALSLSQNKLNGPLVPALGNLPELVVMNLPNNQLSGSIPFELGNLGKLQTLDLYGNQLSGQVPFTLGNLTKLSTLRLYDNKLSSFLPSQLANLTGLLTLDIGYNSLTAVDPALKSFLDGRQPGWANTQTVAPGNLQATVRSGTSVALTWDPIAYTADGGYYQVYSTTQNSGVYAKIANTLYKSDSGYIVEGLTPGQTYSFLVRTFTPKHGLQQNDLLSDSTEPVTVVPAASVATITIALDVLPDSKTNFAFTGGLSSFALDDIAPQDGDAYSASKTFTVPAGVYTVTEQPVAGYLDANIFCSPPAHTIADLFNHQVVIDAFSGTNITCTFVEQRAGQIIAGSYNDRNHNHVRNNNEEWLNGWEMQMHTPFTTETITQTTAGEGRTTFNKLFAGTYTVCMLPQTGWYVITPTTLNTTYQQPCYTVAVAPGKAVWIRFGDSSTPLVAAADVAPVEDVVVCELPPTDDSGMELAAERDPWEEEEDSGNTAFLPVVEGK